MSVTDYCLSNVLGHPYHDQLALEAALMELTLLVESQGHVGADEIVRGALQVIGETAGHIKQWRARFKLQN